MTEKNSQNSINIGATITRFITSSIILAVIAFFTPGFDISTLGTLLLISLLVTLFDYLVNSVIKTDSQFLKGIMGFIISTAIFYFAQVFVPGYTVGIASAVVAGAIYGVVASF